MLTPVPRTRGDEPIEAMLAAAMSLEEFGEMVLTAYPDLDTSSLADVIARAMLAAHAGGRATTLLTSD